MKKFYLLAIILLVSGFGYAQAPELGSYEVIFSGWVYNDEHHNCGTAYVTLEFATPADNYKALDITYSDNRATDYYTYDGTRTTFKANKILQSMFFSASRYDRQSCRGNRPYNMGRVTRADKFRCYDADFEFKQFRNVDSDGDGLGKSLFNVKIRPILVIVDPGIANDLPTDTQITLRSNTGFDSSEYKWQYTLNPTASNDPNSSLWINLPQYNGLSSFSANAVDILGANVINAIGKPIRFRQVACGGAVSKPVTYNVRLSAPKVLSSQSIQPLCSNSKDGSVKLVFNRKLYTGEQLRYTLLDVVTDTPTDYNGDLLIDDNKSFIIGNILPGKYTLQLIGFKDGLNTSTFPSDLFDLATFTIKPPPILDFTLSHTDVFCNNGQDGTITIAPTGGTRDVAGNDYYSLNGGDWVSFPNNKSYTIKGLSAGKYKLRIKDMNGCIAKVQTLVNGEIQLSDDDKVIEETVSEPILPLTVNYTLKTNPTFYGGSNGKIVAAITGGTIYDDKTYQYEWTNSNGDALPATAEYNTTDKTFNITLNNIPKGEYKLTVKDKNYSSATGKAGCSIINSSQSLSQPDKIEIILEITQHISCNSESLNPLEIINKATDGILKATVKGGIQFTGSANGGLPYKFIWSKHNTETNAWDLLEDYKTDTAADLSEGIYSLNVEDANGIVQGTYNTIKLETAIPAIQEILEPNKLEITFTSGNVSCHEGNNGWAAASVTGGAAGYTYQWYNTGSGVIDGNKISDLTLGTYTVEVKDKNGCFATADVKITEPDGPLEIDYSEIFMPTFSGATNGRIVAKITGGTSNKDNGSYNFVWKNKAGDIQSASTQIVDGVYTITLDGVPADSYFLTVKDENYNEAANQIINCSVLESEVKLTEPDPLKVVFEVVQTISCNSENEFGDDTDTTPNDGKRDESQDGILKAYVTGGIPLASSANAGRPYYFYWKKQQGDGSWIALSDIKGDTASNLSHGNYALNIEDRNGIRLGTYINNQLTQEIDVTQFMQQPPKLSVSITKGDVFCNEGNDGWAKAHVVGGTPPYEYKWSNGVEIDENTVLKAGVYPVLITDFRGCSAFESIEIEQPKVPLSIKYIEVLDPSFYKATNGKIVVEVTGGTIAADNTYWFEWKNSKGVIQTTTTTSFVNDIYTISLNGLGEEIYTLTVRDANYNAATNKTSCTVVNSVTELDDPDPLEVTFEVIRTISCNVSNEFGNETDTNPLDNQRDESQDGILKAHVKGGIQLPVNKNNGLPYYYTWKKKQKDGSWTLWNNTGDTAEYLSEGTYALNIEDANGIKLGTYVNNVLVEEKDVEKYIPQPDPLKLSFTKFDVGCTTGDDGWAEAHVTGGTPPYTYEWTNGETTSKIENITTNNYFVIVKDDKGCVVQGSIFVGDPNGILTTETVKDPICYQGNDGSIELNVTGGNLPYTYLWNTGAVTKDLNNLTAGNYEVTITCPDCCVYKKRFVLKDPQSVIVNIGADRTLCIDQSLDLNASIADPKAQYSWTSTNGFTSNEAIINVSKAGTYRVKVTSGLGCIGEDEIVIKTSQMAISAEFLLSSQAYLDEEVILVNTSNPFGESTDWVIPKGVKIVEQQEKFITLKFDAVGVYSIGLQQTQGECYAVYTKNITVEQRGTLPSTGTTSQFVLDFIVTPNPSDGNFKAIVNLENNSAINLRLFSSAGQNTMIQKQESGKKKYEVDFNTSLSSGIYVLVLETGQQTLVKKIIIY
ncbi:T9SS type A sorting domain-containing protein [Flavobacterium johnsoniae]|uniref:T9SS type A sorting domain-containing protein n=1 Tax=Flavobacterium johnsoniae TaxID=986 RepID=UPI003D99F52A